MEYAVSDLHGCLELWLRALKEINFSQNDKIYILGDVLDKGEQPIELLLNIMSMSSKSVYMINGNHELEFLRNYKYAFQTKRKITDGVMYDRYLSNGGKTTMHQFIKCSPVKRRKITNFLINRRLYVENDKFVMTHSGIDNFASEKPLNEYTPGELTFHRLRKGEHFFDNKVLISGHTPNIMSNGEPAKIYVSDDGLFYDIDCGCVFPEYGGRLAVLCLDTMEPIYFSGGKNE